MPCCKDWQQSSWMQLVFGLQSVLWFLFSLQTTDVWNFWKKSMVGLGAVMVFNNGLFYKTHCTLDRVALPVWLIWRAVKICNRFGAHDNGWIWTTLRQMISFASFFSEEWSSYKLAGLNPCLSLSKYKGLYCRSLLSSSSVVLYKYLGIFTCCIVYLFGCSHVSSRTTLLVTMMI